MLQNSTIRTTDATYVEGLNGGTWIRTEDGYCSSGRPCMQHPLTMDDAGLSSGEDYADMFMNWVQNSFADNAKGDARFKWMDSHMGNWVYLSVNR